MIPQRVPVALWACVAIAVADFQHGDSSEVDVYISSNDGSKKHEKQPSSFLVPQVGGADHAQVSVNEDVQYQEMFGFGAALTDSAAWVLHSKSEELFNATMEQLFGASGLRVSILRVNMGASDFTLGWNQNYAAYKAINNLTYDDVENDWDLAHFSTSRDDAHLLPVIKKAKELNPMLRIMGTPWTAPLWMKTACRNHVGSPAACTDFIGTGTLINDTRTYRAYGEYFAKFVESYRKKGVIVDYLTLQNEALHPECGNDMPCMHLEEWQEQRLAGEVALALARKGLGATKILGWDHNWDHPEYSIGLLDGSASKDIAGLAFHCYGGNVNIQTQMHNMFPWKEMHITECDSGAWNPSFGQVLMSDMNGVYIAGANNWVQSVTMWNLALDENHGPTCSGWACCKGCRPLVIMPTHAQSIQDVSKTVEYYAMAHFSSQVLPGAKRIAVTLDNVPSSLEAVAFFIPTSGRTVLVVGNTGTTTVASTMRIGSNDTYAFSVPPGVVTISWASAAQYEAHLDNMLGYIYNDASFAVLLLAIVSCGICMSFLSKRSSTSSEAGYQVLPDALANVS